MSGSGTDSASAFFLRIATFVSRSGGWMSAIRPHSKRDRSRSSRDGISRGGQSLLMTSCFWASKSELNVWKNSVCVPSLPGQELDVVHEQHVHRAVALAELEDPVVLDRVDHLVHEPLARDVGEAVVAVVVEDVVPDRVHQVRLAQAHAAVDEQRVVGARRAPRPPPGRRPRRTGWTARRRTCRRRSGDSGRQASVTGADPDPRPSLQALRRSSGRVASRSPSGKNIDLAPRRGPTSASASARTPE